MDEYKRIAYKDDELTVYPIRSCNSKNGHEIYSYMGIPTNAPPKFLPTIAKELGCIPNIHFKPLS